MAGLIERYGDPGGVLARRGRQPGDAYGALVRAIVGQQLSAASARAIYGRLTGLFGERTPTPRELLATDVAALRGVGLSAAKVAFLRDLAEHVEDGELDLERLPELSDEEVFEQLSAVKGLGPWTIDVFLLFHLGRAGCAPGGRRRHQAGGAGGVRPRRHARRCRAAPDRGALAPAPLARLPLSVAVAGQPAGLGGAPRV